jgi:hypothetical protein
MLGSERRRRRREYDGAPPMVLLKSKICVLDLFHIVIWPLIKIIKQAHRRSAFSQLRV